MHDVLDMQVHVMHLRGMKLAAYLSEHDIDDTAFAEAIGCDRTTVSRLRRDITRPTWPQVERISAATGGLVTADDFMRPSLSEAS